MQGIDQWFNQAIEDLKNEMNFSSLIYMVNCKAETTYVRDIKNELDSKIFDNWQLSLENQEKLKKLRNWVEKLTEVLAWVETIVKVNYPLAL